MSAQAFNYRWRTLRDLYGLFKKHDLLQRAKVLCEYGKKPEDGQLGSPFVRWEPGDGDSFVRGGPARAKDTALPRKSGQPSEDVTAKAIWTRQASVDLWLYTTAATGIDEFLDVVVSALDDLLLARGNYDLLGGRNEPKESHSDSGDVYVLSITVNLPVLRLQRRSAAEAAELTEEATV